jgi:hypothetical protein
MGKDKQFPRNCGNCIHSSLEVFKDDKIACDKHNTLEDFYTEKECYE